MMGNLQGRIVTRFEGGSANHQQGLGAREALGDVVPHLGGALAAADDDDFLRAGAFGKQLVDAGGVL
jgi:hypothetical protein